MTDDHIDLVENAMRGVQVFTVAHTGQVLAEVPGMETDLWALADTEEKAREALRVVVQMRLRKLYREMGMVA